MVLRDDFITRHYSGCMRKQVLLKITKKKKTKRFEGSFLCQIYYHGLNLSVHLQNVRITRYIIEYSWARWWFSVFQDDHNTVSLNPKATKDDIRNAAKAEFFSPGTRRRWWWWLGVHQETKLGDALLTLPSHSCV